jgi:hypothetical protein
MAQIEALQLRIDALQPLARSHNSCEWLNEMADAVEQCLVTIDRTVMVSAERMEQSRAQRKADEKAR